MRNRKKKEISIVDNRGNIDHYLQIVTFRACEEHRDKSDDHYSDLRDRLSNCFEIHTQLV